MTLLNKIKSIDCGILEQSDTTMTKIFLFVDNKVGAFSNILIFNSTIDSHIYQTNWWLFFLLTNKNEKHYVHYLAFLLVFHF